MDGRQALPWPIGFPGETFFMELGCEGVVFIPIIRCVCFGGGWLDITMLPCMKISSSMEKLGLWPGTLITTRSGAYMIIFGSSVYTPRSQPRKNPNLFRKSGRQIFWFAHWSYSSKPIWPRRAIETEFAGSSYVRLRACIRL